MTLQIITLSVYWLCAASICAKPKPLFTSPTVTTKTPGHAVEIDVELKGAKKLFLVIEDAGNESCDHADWAEPRLTGDKGTLKLTDLKWKSAYAQWAKPVINKSVAGGAMRINGKTIPYGIGTHAYSIIEYDVPTGYSRFKAIAGLDNSGTDQQGGKTTSVIFKVYTEKPIRPGHGTFEVATPGQTYVPTELFQVPEGMEITVWATSPLFFNPTNIDFDKDGRAWIAEGRNYRGKRGADGGDRIVVVQDTDHDGQADKSHTFVQETGFISPLGIAVIDNKVVVSQPPDLIVYTDKNRNLLYDEDIDTREVLLTGFDGKNHDHSLHSVTVGPNGQWYFNFGNKGGDVTDKEGWNLKAGSPYSMRHIAGHKSSDGQIYLGGVACRVNPDGTGLRPIGHNFRNSYEQTLTSFGDVFQNDNDDPPAARTAWLMEYGNAGFASNDGKRSWGADRRWGQDTPTAEWRQDDPGSMPAGDVYGGGAPTGIVYYENGALGEEWNNLLLSCEPARNTVFGYKPKLTAAGFALERFDFVTTNPEKDFAGADFRRGKMGTINTLFRPSDVAVGPDGAIYVSDWFDARVGGHQTLDGTQAGTIYRIAPKGKKLTVPSIDITRTDGQISALKSPAVNVRSLGFMALKAQRESALPALKTLLKNDNPAFSARAVWLIAQAGPDGISEVTNLLKHKNPQFRIVAFRALRYVDHELLAHATTLAKDPHPAVRREVALALRNLSFEQTRDILTDIARGYDGTDRWYLEAFGTGATGKESQLYDHLKASIGGDPRNWSTQFADLAWRLRPPAAIQDLITVAIAPTTATPSPERLKMLVPVGLTDSLPAVEAMVMAAKLGPDDVREEAKRWITKQQKTLWKKYDAAGILTGTATPRAVYSDHLVPENLGNETQLPPVGEILRLKGNIAQGKIEFARCYMCHKMGGAGVDFGPNLTHWGKGQPPEVIAEGIVNPSSDIAHGFAGTEIKTKSGKTIQGFVIAEGDPIVLRVFGGEQIGIDAADIGSRKNLEGSFMVPASKMGLTAQQVRDLVAYLKSGR